MSLSEKLATDVLITTAINLAQKVRGLVFIPLLTRLLGLSAYGAFVQVRAVTRIVAKVSLLGLHSALVRYWQERSGRGRPRLYANLMTVALATATLASVALFAAADTVARTFLGSAEYTPLFLVGASLVPVFAAQEMAENYYRAEMRVKRYSVYQGAKTYLNVATVAVVLLAFDAGIFWVVTATVATEALFAVVLQVLVLRSIGLHRPTFDGLADHLRYSVPLMGGSVSGMVQDRFDRLLVGFFLGASSVGVYSVAYTLARVLRLFFLPLQVTFFPEFSRLWEEGDRETCYRYLRSGFRYVVGLTTPAVVGLYLVAEPLIGLLSTQAVASRTPVLVLVLGAGVAFWGLDVLYRQLFYAAGRSFVVSALRAAGAVVNVGLNLLLIPPLGIVGAAVATLVTFASVFAVVYGLTVREFGIDAEWGFATKAVFSALVMFVVVAIGGVRNVVVLLVVCPPIYFASLFATGGLEREEVLRLADTLGGLNPRQ